MKRKDIKIKDCFWFKNGKCRSPESFRFIGETDRCPYDPDLTAFITNFTENRLRCLEFRHEH